MINKAIILAAGNGKRMRRTSPSTEQETPKVLRKLLGIPIIEWTVRKMKALGLDVYVVINPQERQKFEEVLQKYDVKYIFENQPLGTAHALYSVKEAISDELFLVLMGDDISNISRDNLIDSPAIFVHNTPDISSFGSVVIGNDGFVIDIKEKEDSGEGLANTGIYIMPNLFFDQFKNLSARENGEYYLTDALISMVRQGLYIRPLPIGYWKPINNQQDLTEAESELSKFNYTELEIRTAKEEDFVGLMKLLTELSKTTEKNLLKNFNPLKSFQKILANENESILVSVYDKRLISSVTMIIKDNISHGGLPYCHIENVVTEAELRNRGIGLLNLQFAITIARISQCYKVILNCKPNLINFYKKVNLQVSGEIEMRKNLD